RPGAWKESDDLPDGVLATVGVWHMPRSFTSSGPAHGDNRISLAPNHHEPKRRGDKAGRSNVRPARPSRHSKSIYLPPTHNPDPARRPWSRRGLAAAFRRRPPGWFAPRRP